MTFRSSIVEKIGTFLDETIDITLKCTMHLHGHRNKVVPLMKPFILADINNGVKFRNHTYSLTNDIWNHYTLHQVSNHHIDNKNLVLSGHVEISS
jgi:hypothetical protein